MPRYEVYVSGKSTSRDDWRKPVVVRVVDTSQSYWHAVRKLNDGILYESGIVDSRHDGPRARYGQAIRLASKIAIEMNLDEEEARPGILEFQNDRLATVRRTSDKRSDGEDAR